MTEKKSRKSYQDRRKKMITITALVVLVVFIVWTILGTLLSAVYADGVESKASGEIEMKGIWVSTVYSLDYPASPTTDASALKAQADSILDNSKAMGMTAVFLQVRPSADALYDSDYYPWSKYLTGAQGTAPGGGFDPLAYWVQAAHDRGLELHAWINPYRVTRSGDTEYVAMSADNPAKQHPEWLVKYSDNYYFDPALPEVRELVVNGALEIVNHYDVDGIHLDDYFYPGKNFDDAASYAKYGQGFSDIGDFRRDNVNQLIRTLDEKLHAADPDISFGVSPFGIWANNTTRSEGSATRGTESYSDYYADTVYWAKEGIVDYLAPQIYWNIGYSVADYSVLVKWWSDILKDTDVKLYIGLADYRSAQATDSSSVWYGTSELKRQMDLNRSTSGVSGEIHFRYRLMQEDANIPAFLADYYGSERNNGTDTPIVESHKIALNTPYGGSVSVDKTSAAAGETVQISVSADSGYRLIYLTAMATGSSGGQPAALTDLGGGKYSFVMPDSDVSVAAGFAAEEGPEAGPFADVSEADWYFDAVDYAKQNNLMNGTSDMMFSPGENLSRAMMVTILHRLAGTPAPDSTNSFSDVEAGMWFTDAVTWANENQIVTGYGGGAFGPSDNITREQMAAILCRYAKSAGYDVSEAGESVDLSAASSVFKDGTDVSPYAVDSVKWAVGCGLLSGKGDGVLDPQGTATRAEVAQILMRFCENVLK